MPRYLATINTPGYLPWDDDPPVFDTPREAWEYLADHRKRAEDDALDFTGYSETANTLESLGDGTLSFEEVGDGDGTGSVHGLSTEEKMYDLGVNYSVTIAEEE
jgi:hypothetical protein